MADLVELITDLGPDASMFTVDIARAYRNFRSDPLDWPLLCVSWGDDYYIDVSMPFGARASSCHMQRVADFIVRILEREGICGAMYLDDLVVVAPDPATAHLQYARVRALLKELGLPEAADKTQPPSTNIKWLGIDIDSHEMSLSIPADKVREVLECMERCKSARSLHRKQLQSLIGKLMHLAKCVPPARVFMSRNIEALSDMKGAHFTRVTPSIRADLEWFTQFAAAWNGKSLIPQGAPYRTIQVDACLTGIGATDGTLAYAGRIAPDDDPVANITEIEAANLVIALHTFITENDRGKHVKIECDNQATVQALLYSRAHNKILCECARAVWMVQALFDLKLTFVHLPGKDNQVADVLSRAHTSNLFYSTASEMINTSNLLMIQPCTYVLSFSVLAILSRSGIQLAGSEGGGSTASGPNGGDHGGTPSGRQGPLILRPPVPDGPDVDDGRRRVPIDRAPHHGRGITGHRAEQGLQHEGLRATGWWQTSTTSVSAGRSHGGKEDRLHHVQEAGHPPGPSEGCSQGHPRRPQRQYAKTAVLLMYFGVLRQSEVAPPTMAAFNPARHLTRADITLSPGVKLVIKHAKNLQKYNQNKVVRLSPTGDMLTCPVGAVTWALAAMPQATASSPLLAFKDTGRPIPNSHLRAAWGAAVRRAGADPSMYSLHSLRKTAATAAFRAGCTELEIQRHGGWSSGAHRDYIETETANKMNSVLMNAIMND